jgi:hypothetical protein
MSTPTGWTLRVWARATAVVVGLTGLSPHVAQADLTATNRAPARADARSAEDAATYAEVELFTRRCFTQYVTLASATGGTAAAVRARGQAMKKVLGRCIAWELRAQWRKIVEARDADPLLDAQDTAESWKSDVRVENLALDLTDRVGVGSARVILGRGDEAHCLDVTYLPARGGHPLIASSRECAPR